MTKSSAPVEQSARTAAEGAVRPYPSQWERRFVIGTDWKIFTRPIRADDEPLILQLLQHVSKEDLRYRFFDSIKKFTYPFLARLTDLDYARAMAFVALDEASGDVLGVVRIHSDAARETGEYAILLRSDLKGHGLGWALMEMMIEYARSEGLLRINGQVLQANLLMLKMCREFGFAVKSDPKDRGVCDVTLVLHQPLESETRP